MKKAVFVLVAILTVTMGMAQDDKSRTEQEFKTIFNGNRNNNKIIHGGYGGIMMNYTQIDNKDAFLAGLRGMWIINHGIGIGIGGYGFANELHFDHNSDNNDNDKNDYSLAGGYGGLVIEPIIGAKHPVHVSFPVLIGAGGVAAIRDYYWSTNHPHDDYEYYAEDAEAFFVVEPGVEVELNMVKFFRIAIGGYYRFTSNVSLYPYYTSEVIDPELSGFSVGLTLKFGKF
jgi:hypothetical protein